MAPGRVLVPAARRHVQAPGELAWLQVGRAQLRAAAPHRPGRRDHRRRRLRLPGRAGVAARLRAALRRPVDRVRAGAAGLPRLAPRPLLPAALLLLQVLLRRLPALKERARRRDLRRHHGPDQEGRPRRARRLGRMVHHRRRGDLAQAAPRGLVRHARRRVRRPRDHAADVRGAQGPAVPLVLRRHPAAAHALEVPAPRPGDEQRTTCRPASAGPTCPARCSGTATCSGCCSSSSCWPAR